MTTYRITSKRFCAAVVTNGGVILQAAPILKQFVGHELATFLTYANDKGWSIEPLQPVTDSDWIHIEGDLYEIKWAKGRTRIIRISLHQENGEVVDKAYSELPALVKQAVI